MDVVIEMLANVNLQADLELLAMGGIVAVSCVEYCKRVCLYAIVFQVYGWFSFVIKH